MADELERVELAGHEAWVLPEADPAASEPVTGVRLLPAPELRLLGRDRTGLFAGPGLRVLDAAADTFHPNGVLVDGVLAGSWGRKGGRVDVRLSRAVPAAVREEIEAEALALPVPGARMSVEIRQALIGARTAKPVSVLASRVLAWTRTGGWRSSAAVCRPGRCCGAANDANDLRLVG